MERKKINLNTLDGVKKSARGLLRVEHDSNGEFYLLERVTPEEEAGGDLQTVFLNGELHNETSLSEIRERLWG